MKVLGTVKDVATEVPLPGAKIRLYVREEELAVLQSDSEGKFKHKSESQYIGEILICKVEKAGYEPQKVIQEFEEDEVTLAIKLVHGKEEKIELTVNLKDKKRNPLKGINISLEVDGEGVGVGISDKDGIFKISLSPDLEGKTIKYKAELGGFELGSGEVQLKKETSVKITMKKPPAPLSDRKWLKIAAGATGIVAVILVAIIISQIIPPDGPPEMPEIKYFEASPSAISAGEGSKLSWDVSDATSVTIDPEIGRVALTGTRQASPTETTIYTLTATNDAGNRFDTVKVIVKEEEVNLPVISSFETSPSAISAGEGSKLSWIVSDATRVTMEPGIGRVDLKETIAVYPTETTIYTLTATNDAGNRFALVKVIVKPKEMPVINVADRLEFKEVQLGETDEEDLTIENKGQVTLEVEKVTVDDYHFTIRGRTRFSIQPNDYEKLTVSFKPDAEGPQIGKLTITSNDPEHQIATVELRGSGALAILTPTPTPTPTPPPAEIFTNTIGMEFVLIPAGEFEMGSPSDEEGRWKNEGPVHHVNIEKAFYMGKYEVTQNQWRAIMGDDPSYFKGDDLPAEQVSWDDVQEFIKKLNEKEGTGKYRLPSEAEWEYACRAGTSTRYSFGVDGSKLGDYAWYYDNSGKKTHPVGQKKPNSWGLYDMYGNVWEWVQDSWHDSYNGAPADGSAWEGDGARRVDRGGCWFNVAGDCRSAERNPDDPRHRVVFLGFRLLKSL